MLLPPPLAAASAAAAPIIPHDAPRLARRAPKTTIAFVDLETTGLDPSRHDIIEIGIVRVNARTLEVLDEHEALVMPERLGDAQLDALAVNGFSTAAWERALPLREALLAVAPLLDGALIAGHNVGFDWSFLEAGFRRGGLALPNVDYHRLDTASLAWPLVVTGELPSMSLDPLAKLLGLERPHPHRALADARCSLEIARRLVERMRAAVLTGLRRTNGRSATRSSAASRKVGVSTVRGASMTDATTRARPTPRCSTGCTTRPRSWCAVVASRPVAVDASTSAARSRTTRPATSSESARSASSSSKTARSPSRRTFTCRSSSTRRRDESRPSRSASSCSPPATRSASSARSSPRAWSASCARRSGSGSRPTSFGRCGHERRALSEKGRRLRARARPALP
ncbi:MAG: 3'-5' exonuclease [Gemmatimonadetes bacterium]|nr:3'-5' exonuclease [Gemmatimonadota bacterium]